MDFCKGINARNNECRNKVKNGETYCDCHKDQHIEFYRKVDENYPTTKQIKFFLKKANTIKEIKSCLKVFLGFRRIEPQQLFWRYLAIFCSMECLKLNVGLYYSTPHFCNIITNLSNNPLPQLKEYYEDFKEKCLAGYAESKKNAKKKLIMFYMIHTEGLCYDVVEHIMTFY
jgi:hypothetical protein